MAEFDPDAHLLLQFTDGREARMDRNNSALFTFLGDLAMHDHVFVLTNAENNSGSYIFRHSPVFDAISEYMMENDFPMHLNMTEVAECDQQAFQKCLEQEAADLDGIPDDWVE